MILRTRYMLMLCALGALELSRAQMEMSERLFGELDSNDDISVEFGEYKPYRV